VDEANDPSVTISCLCAAPRKPHDHLATRRSPAELTVVEARQQERLSREIRDVQEGMRGG